MRGVFPDTDTHIIMESKMDDKRKYLVVVDIPGIKEYVFGTDRLVEIRGASALLKRVNEVSIYKYLSDCGNLSTIQVFAGGGSGHFIVEAQKRGDLEDALSKLKTHVLKESRGGFGLVCGFAEYFEDKYDESLRKALISLEQDKDENPPCYNLSVHTGFIRECESCSGEANTFKKYHKDDDAHALCSICAQKLKSGQDKESGLGKELSSFLKNKGIDCGLPTDFEEIGNGCLAKSGYTALVYADGNDLGKTFRNIKTQKLYHFISKTVEESLRVACMEAIIEVCKPVENVLPASILLLGGDDLLVYLAADTAIPFAISVAKKFGEEASKRINAIDDSSLTEQLANLSLTISLGISFGKSHTPFSIMLNQAEELLRSAKKTRRNKIDSQMDSTNQPYIDYHLASNFNQIDVKSSRLNHLTLCGNYVAPSKQRYLRLYQKPYSLKELETLWDSAKSLLKSGISSTKLRQLGYAPTLGKINGIIEYLYTFTRLKNDEQRRMVADALSKFGCKNGTILWREHENSLYDSTVLMDLVEIAEFIKKN